jgi:hypothetical protein
MQNAISASVTLTSISQAITAINRIQYVSSLIPGEKLMVKSFPGPWMYPHITYLAWNTVFLFILNAHMPMTFTYIRHFQYIDLFQNPPKLTSSIPLSIAYRFLLAYWSTTRYLSINLLYTTPQASNLGISISYQDSIWNCLDIVQALITIEVVAYFPSTNSPKKFRDWHKHNICNSWPLAITCTCVTSFLYLEMM